MICKPLISVILPCYNVELYLIQAIESLINQTYDNIEIIALNDGSTDGTIKILERYASQDSRVIVVNNNKNLGLIETLNKGVLIAKGEYIARMDADDVAHKNRLEIQRNFLEERCLDVLSSSVFFIDSNGYRIGKSFLRVSQPLSCFFQSFYANPIIHPSLFIKTIILKNNIYGGENTNHCEDFELWNRLAIKGFKFGNIKENLLSYRILKSSVSNKFKNIQEANHTLISKNKIESFFNIKMSLNTASVLNNRIDSESQFSDLFRADRVLRMMLRIMLKTNSTTKEYSEIHQTYVFQISDICIQSVLKAPFIIKLAGLTLFVYRLPLIIQYRGIYYLKNKLLK